MKIKRISTLGELYELAEPWHCLTRGVPFRSLAWLGSWWRHYGDDKRLLALAVFGERGLLVGLAPLFIERRHGGERVLRLLGSGAVCSDYLSLLSTPEHEDRVATAVARWLASAAERSADGNTSHHWGWDLLELTGVAESDRAIAKLTDALVERGATVDRRRGLNCWRIALPDSWEDYLASLSKSHRKQVRRVQRRYLDSGKARLRTAASDDELDRGMQILADLHTRRRESLGQEGCFGCRRFSGFLNEAARQLFQQQCLQLHWIELEGRAVAAEFHLSGGGATYAYQAGIDPDALDEEPGRIINVAVLKRAIDEGRQTFDFLRGDEPYKAHWRAEPAAMLHLRIVPPRATAQLRRRVWLTGDRMKHWVKGALAAAGL